MPVFLTTLGSEMTDNFNIKRKVLNFELRVLVGWLSRSICLSANQKSERVPLRQTFLFLYFKVAYHFRPEYTRSDACSETKGNWNKIVIEFL